MNTQSAFPWVSQGGVHEHQVVEGGLTKREYFAAVALNALLMVNTYASQDSVANSAKTIADLMLRKLDETT